ncbi:MAG: hypothetical protein WC893_00720 [Candidatus Paceibacterota bacterium]|jgi:hypothetical protein
MIQIKLKNFFYSLIYLYFLSYLTLALKASAQQENKTGYILLEPSALTGIGEIAKEPIKLTTYLKGAYQTFFVIVFSAAVIMIVWAGFEYMMTDVISSKSKAKKRLKDAFWGLAIAGFSYLILYIINPDLVQFNLNL